MKNCSSTHASRVFSIADVAHILGVDTSHVCRLVRVGTVRAVWRRGRLVIPAGALLGLLGEPVSRDPWAGDA